jgi:hypothetical protein
MTDLSKTMKRERLGIKPLISHKTVLVSGRFRFRFTPEICSFGKREWINVTSSLAWCAAASMKLAERGR